MMFLLCMPFCLWGHFFDTKDEGWHFYHDQNRPPIQNQNREQEPKTLKELKEKVQALLEEAVFHPTPQNVLRYQRLQKKVLDKSELFANIWAAMLIEEPDLDNTIDAPTSYYGNLAKKAEDQSRHEITMKNLSQTHGLILLIDNRATSQKLRAIVQDLAMRRQIPLVAINVDQNPEIASQWAVKKIPAILLQHRVKRSTKIIGYGLLAADTLEERMSAS